MTLSLVTGPQSEPVTTAEAKAWLRVEHAEHDSLIADLVKSARLWCEGVTRRAFVAQTWDLKLDRFPAGNDKISIPRPPLISISSVKYIDTAGTEQTWSSSNYTVDAPAGPEAPRGCVYPVYGKTWPTPRAVPNAVTVRFKAGHYDDTVSPAEGEVPDGAKTAIKLLVRHWYENPSAVEIGTIATRVQLSAEALLAPLKVYEAI